MVKNYDFSGWATKCDLLCGDGRIIRKNAFKNQDGTEVPLVWNHQHNDPKAVLGHAILENRDDGVYAYCIFNESDAAKHARQSLIHGDVSSLSIWANRLKQVGNDVIHGVIRELSLVLSGANPGAYVDFVMGHSDDDMDGLYAHYDERGLILCHSSSSDDDEKKTEKGDSNVSKQTTNNDSKETIEDILKTFNEKQKQALFAIVGMALEDAEAEKGSASEKKEKEKEEEKAAVKHSDIEDETVGDILETFNEKQKKVLFALVGIAIQEAQKGNETVEHSDIEGGTDFMKHNVFEQSAQNSDVLTHSEMTSILDDAKRNGSLADAVLSHGIEQIDYLFPDAKTMDVPPSFIKRDDTWVTEFMNGLHKSPMSRIKSIHADITEADARAKGYVKGNEKIDEVFTLLKRVTTPTTVYKKQKIDRDDVVDITDFDVIAWLKTEMRMMLNEELARAVLVGDGRSSSSNDKINEQNIRPIWTDDDVYTIKVAVDVTSATTEDEKAKAFIKSCIRSRKEYKGSGNPIMYISEDMLTNCLLLEDLNGRVIYDSIDKLATAIRCRKIVSVPVMEDLTRVVGANTHTLAGIYVNPSDYNLGADKGGAINLFDDFDIDFNAQKYLIETRCSGALTVPYSAVAIEFVAATESTDASTDTSTDTSTETTE